MSEKWEPKIPRTGTVFCAICREPVTAPPFVASKPRRGPIIYIHTACFEKEQRELKETNKQ